MKKFQIRLLIVALAALSLAGCNSKSSFELMGKADVYQDFGEFESAVYSTHVLYTGYNGTIAQSTIMHDGLPLTPYELPNSPGYYYTHTSETSSIEDALGNFTINATDTEGETTSGDIVAAFDQSRLMDKLEIASFEYDSPVLRAKIRRQADIDAYAFYIVKGNNTVLMLNSVEGEVEDYDADYVNIYYRITQADMDKKLAVSVAGLQSLRYLNGNIIQRSITRTIEPGAEEFTEGNYPSE